MPCYRNWVKIQLGIEKSLAVIFFVAFFILIGVSISLALHIDIDYYDAFDYLREARRLTDPTFMISAFSIVRPRTPVMLLTFYNLVFKWLFSRLPSLHEYHLLMVVQTAAFVLVWVFLVRKLFGSATGYLTGICLQVNPLMIHYGFIILTDIQPGLLWGISLLTFVCLLEKRATALSRKHAIVMGFLGALLGASKNHLLPIVPCVLGSWYFLHSSTSLFGTLPFRSLKDMRRWIGVVILTFLVCLDLFTRIFGKWGAGIGPLFKRIYFQARHAGTEHVPPEIYIEYIWEMVGPAFCILSFTSLFFLAVHFWRTREEYFSLSPYWRRVGTISLVLITVLFTVLTQYIPHREIRYLIPFLPALLALVSRGALLIGSELKPSMRFVWILFGSLSLIHPILRSHADARIYFADRIYDGEKTGFNAMWEYLKAPARSGATCRQIRACHFALYPLDRSEYPKDPYYRRYDMVPQYEYFTGIPVKTTLCPSFDGDYLKIIGYLSPEVNMETCYVVRQSSHPQALDFLVVLKGIGKGFSAGHLSGIRDLVKLPDNERMVCEQESQAGYACFQYKKFFGN